MSRSLRVRNARKKEMEDIEDIDAILADHIQDVTADESLDVIPEEPTEIPEDEEEAAPPPKPKKRATMSIKVGARGKRSVKIQELDPNIIPPTYEDYMDPKHTGSKIAVIGKPGCFAKGTSVQLYDGGRKSVENIKVGDQLLGDDYKVRNVSELCSGKEMMYQITVNKEELITVNERHILSLYNVVRHQMEDMTVQNYLSLSDTSQFRWVQVLPDQTQRMKIFDVNQTEEDNYYGFIIDGNHRFLGGNHSVLHNTGKSSIIRSILYEKSGIFPCAQVYSGTEDSNHAYSEFIPSTFIFNNFSQANYADFVRRQKIAKQYLENPWCVNVWDDITEDERIFNLPIVKGTYKNGRHWKMLHILSLQYALDIKPVIRTNVDGSFILRETNKRNRKTLFENYASAIDDYSDFCSIMDQVTNDYTSLYIHNRVQSNNFEDCVFWYKARDDIPPDFQLGCNEMWMFHKERYNPLYVDPIGV